MTGQALTITRRIDSAETRHELTTLHASLMRALRRCKPEMIGSAWWRDRMGALHRTESLMRQIGLPINR
jgi:hypothetical protein